MGSLISRNGKVQGLNIAITVGCALIMTCMAIKAVLVTGIFKRIKDSVQSLRKEDDESYEDLTSESSSINDDQEDKPRLALISNFPERRESSLPADANQGTCFPARIEWNKHVELRSDLNINDTLFPNIMRAGNDNIDPDALLSDRFTIASQSHSGFPINDRGFVEIMQLIADSKNNETDDYRSYMDIQKIEDLGSESKMLDAFTFELDDQTFEAFYADSVKAKATLSKEVSDFLEILHHIRRTGSSIALSPKMLLSGINSREMILVREVLDTEASCEIGRSEVLNDKEKCYNTAKELAKLANHCIFTIPGDISKHKELLKKFNKVKEAISSKTSTNILECGFNARELLGEDFFTYSRDSSGSICIEIMSVVIPDNNIGTLSSLEDHDILLCNYALIFTIFPNNAEDMLRVISVSEEEREILMKIAETTLHNMRDA